MQTSVPQNPLVLAIDTAGPRLQLALAGTSDVEIFVEDITRGHAEIIFDRIADLLSAKSQSYQDLTRLAVTTGPGSFTGLRIGLSVARGLALALSIPVIGVPTLTAMSFSAVEDKETLVFLDARRGEAYCQLFLGPGKPKAPAQILPLDEAKTCKAETAVLLEPVCVDIAALARFALKADPADFPPDPTYIRAADAKPQTKAKISRTGVPAP